MIQYLMYRYITCCDVLCICVVVLFRVITVYPDLKPFMQKINVSISVSILIHILSCGKFYSSLSKKQSLKTKTKTQSFKAKTKTNTQSFKTKINTQRFNIKTKTKTLSFKTKTKSL